jgi:glycosyltransferase involved in cell wall biosynthesis
MAKRVLILVENLPVPFDRRVWQESCALRDAGYEVTVICPQMRGYVNAYEEIDKIKIYRHWISEEANSISGFLREYASALWGQWWCAWKAWRKGGFDIIHYCNPPDLMFLVALPFKILFRVKMIFDVHDLGPEMFAVKFRKHQFLAKAVKAAEYFSAKFADAILSTNQSVSAAIQQRTGCSEEKIFVVRTAPHMLPVTTVADPALLRDRKYLAGYVGVMGSTDGVQYLLDAAHHIIHVLGRKDVQFHLMGSGPEYETLKQKCRELKLAGYVDMPGRVSNEHLFTALQTMHLGVACDPADGYNDHCTMNKTLEYMAFGKPQVMFSTREGVYSAGESALAIMENSAIKLAEGILELLDQPERRAKMGAAGLKRLRNELSWERSVQHLLQAYASVSA